MPRGRNILYDGEITNMWYIGETLKEIRLRIPSYNNEKSKEIREIEKKDVKYDMFFFKYINYFRESFNLSLKETTLSKIKILEVTIEGEKNNIYINVGMNDCKLKDFYIKEIMEMNESSDKINEPIIILKRCEDEEEREEAKIQEEMLIKEKILKEEKIVSIEDIQLKEVEKQNSSEKVIELDKLMGEKISKRREKISYYNKTVNKHELSIWNRILRSLKIGYFHTCNVGKIEIMAKEMIELELLKENKKYNLGEDTEDLKELVIEKLKILTISDRVCEQEVITSLKDYLIYIDAFVSYGWDTLIKFMEKEDYMTLMYVEQKLYERVNNNGIKKMLEERIKEFTDVIDHEDWELQLPDIYILLGFSIFPSRYKIDMWKGQGGWEARYDKNYRFIVILSNLLEHPLWYYIYGASCLLAQVIGPSYYVYNYFITENNDMCPNNLNDLNKLFAVAYYLILYARMNSFWSSLQTTVWQYGNSTLITNENYLRLTLLVNSLCLCIIPFFTYTLFMELSGLTDLILNCLTGEFLINIDNLIVNFCGDETYLKVISRDIMVLTFVKEGYRSNNILAPPSIDFWLLNVVQIVQMFGTLIMTVYIYRCI